MATFGNLSTGASPTDNPSNNFIWCKALSAPATDGTLTSISVYGNIKAGTPSLGVAIYTDSAGVPGALIVAEETTMGSFAAGMGIVTTNLGTSLTSGTQYWLAFRMPGNTGGASPDSNVFVTSSGGATNTWFKNNAAGANFPASVSGATSDSTENYAIFATYTPAAVPGVEGGFKTRVPVRPAPFKPMGDGFRTDKYRGWR